jgi:tRNA A-37 threonylcarbamoyl transferase component Bud32
LQAVYDSDADAGSAVLEAPLGTSLLAVASRPIAHIDGIRQAVAALHEAGIAHGHVDAAHVLVAETRAVLLLPAQHDPQATREADLAALERLLRPWASPTI